MDICRKYTHIISKDETFLEKAGKLSDLIRNYIKAFGWRENDYFAVLYCENPILLHHVPDNKRHCHADWYIEQASDKISLTNGELDSIAMCVRDVYNSYKFESEVSAHKKTSDDFKLDMKNISETLKKLLNQVTLPYAQAAEIIDIVDYSKLINGSFIPKRKICSFAEILAAAVKTTNQYLEIFYSAEIPPLYADDIVIKQIFVNLFAGNVTGIVVDQVSEIQNMQSVSKITVAIDYDDKNFIQILRKAADITIKLTILLIEKIGTFYINEGSVVLVFRFEELES